jgi:hypothetical protein
MKLQKYKTDFSPIAAMVTIHKNTVDNIAKSNKKDKLEKKYFIELI